MHIAIVGAGISGLVAARQLNQQGHQVEVFEKLQKPGFSAHSSIVTIDGISAPVDVPLRVFDREEWNTLVNLCAELNVETDVIDLSSSFSISSDQFIEETLFSYRQAEHNLQRLESLLRDHKNVLTNASVDILGDLLRFNSESVQRLADEGDSQQTLAEFLQEKSFSRVFKYQFLYPMLSTVCTCEFADLDNYPLALAAPFILHMFNIDQLNHAQMGSDDIVDRLLAGDITFHRQQPIEEVLVENNKARIILAGQEAREFDHVIIATQANHAEQLLSASLKKQFSLLKEFKHVPVQVCIHKDERFMPEGREQWKAINFVSSEKQQRAMSTTWMNKINKQWSDSSNVFQTVLPLFSPEPDKLIQSSWFERVVVTPKSRACVFELEEMQKNNQLPIWFCGSYAADGIPLLESGIQSALSVCKWISECSIE